MYVPAELQALTGDWKGPGSLWFTPGAPEAEFESEARVRLEARDNVLCVSYRWTYQGETQEGLLNLGVNAEDSAVHATWTDSWHMPALFMHCRGTYEAGAAISVLGSYEAPPGPDWGWRTAIDTTAPDAWRLVMYNVTPDGEEMLAFEIDFRRA